LLNAAAEGNPSDNSPGTGSAVVILDTVLQTMEVRVVFSGLLSGTTMAHIHCCTPPGTSTGVATTVPSFPNFPLGVTSGSYDQIFDLTAASTYNPVFVPSHGGTVASAEAALVFGLLNNMTYLNIHTAGFPGGEIRALLVSEPATTLLLSVAMGGLALARRRGHKSRR